MIMIKTKIPCFSFFIKSSLSSNFSSFTLSIRPSISPIPERLIHLYLIMMPQDQTNYQHQKVNTHIGKTVNINVNSNPTQQFADKRLNFEWFKVICVFSCTNENDRTLCGCHSEIIYSKIKYLYIHNCQLYSLF